MSKDSPYIACEVLLLPQYIIIDFQPARQSRDVSVNHSHVRLRTQVLPTKSSASTHHVMSDTKGLRFEHQLQGNRFCRFTKSSVLSRRGLLEQRNCM